MPKVIFTFSSLVNRCVEFSTEACSIIAMIQAQNCSNRIYVSVLMKSFALAGVMVYIAATTDR